jgi:pyruvate dehydrogenase E1 component alpha subunit
MSLHFTGDPGGYVNQAMLEEWQKRDPLDVCRQQLLDREALTPEEDSSLRQNVEAEVERAVEEAFAAADPTADDLFEDVYAQGGITA